MKRSRFLLLVVLFFSLACGREKDSGHVWTPTRAPAIDEYLLVTFSEDRPVLVNGRESGRTNEVIAVNGGSHRISLGGAADYTPAWQDIHVSGTTSFSPMEAAFTKAAAAAAVGAETTP